jgi:hypothetical protein
MRFDDGRIVLVVAGVGASSSSTTYEGEKSVFFESFLSGEFFTRVLVLGFGAVVFTRILRAFGEAEAMGEDGEGLGKAAAVVAVLGERIDLASGELGESFLTSGDLRAGETGAPTAFAPATAAAVGEVLLPRPFRSKADLWYHEAVSLAQRFEKSCAEKQ